MSDTNYTRKIYNDFAEIYHKKRHNKKSSFWNRYIDSPAMSSLIKNFVGGKDVLDLGCGTGIFTKKISSWGGSVSGIDISEKMIEIAKKENPGIDFFVANAIKTPFNNNKFDIVSSCLMIHYFKHVGRLFKEVSRILKNDGIFIFSFHHPFNEVLIRSKDSNIQVKPYFNNLKYKWNMKEGLELLSYHHTFENIFSELSKTGFLIEKLLEPRPELRFRKVDINSFDFTKDYPSFCAIKAIKK